MADLLTVYDDGESNSFIDCTICDKRIRGDTNNKIHVTTLQHLKREKILADKGLIPKPIPLPQWNNIKEYLTYLNLSEPIIGLSALVQEEDLLSSDGRAVLRYRCRLCAVTMDLFEMATHVVGRRHRQKYLERNRPDMVTWEKTSEKQAGIVARAKAAIVEKQEGWGNPVALNRSNRGRTGSRRGYDGAAEDRMFDSRRGSLSGRGRPEQDLYPQPCMERDTFRRPSFNEDNQYNQSYGDASDQPSSSRHNQYDAPYSQDSRQARSERERDYRDRTYQEDEMSVGVFGGNEAQDRGYMDKAVPQSFRGEWYSETNSSRGGFKSSESKDYYHGSILETRFNESGVNNYKDDRRMQEPMYASHPETGSSMDGGGWQSRNLMYPEKGRERLQDVDERQGSFEMQGYKRDRYYQADEDDDVPAKRKRKSRFSDASPLEISLAQKSQVDDLMSFKYQKGRAIPPKNQASGSTMDSAVTARMENVLDVLSDIQIENVQEANFLKDKLCTLLKDFQSSKAQRSQVAQSATDFTDSYYGGNKMEHHRDVPESRRFDDHGFQEPARYDRDMQGPRDYLHTQHFEDPKSIRQNRVSEEPEYQWDPYRDGSAGRSEERMARHPDDRRGYREGGWNSRRREDEMGYAEEHRYQHDYRSGGDLYDPFEPSSSPPLDKGSSTLDKLASTLLELVARKKN